MDLLFWKKTGYEVDMPRKKVSFTMQPGLHETKMLMNWFYVNKTSINSANVAAYINIYGGFYF